MCIHVTDTDTHTHQQAGCMPWHMCGGQRIIFGSWFSGYQTRFMWQIFWPTEVIVWAQSQPPFYWWWGTKPRTLNILGRYSPPSTPSWAYKNSLFSTVPRMSIRTKDLMKYSVSPCSDAHTQGVHRWTLGVLFNPIFWDRVLTDSAMLAEQQAPGIQLSLPP